MSDPFESNIPGENEPPPQAPPAPQPSDTIAVTREEYAQLTTQLAITQAQLERFQEDQTARNAQHQAPAQPAKPVDTMTNAELIDMINNHINQNVAQPLMNTIMQLALKEEVREVADKYPDFKDIKSEVYKVAEKNSQLSIEQAYLMVKGARPVPPKVEVPAAKVPTTPPPPSEKPGVNNQAVTPGVKLSAREAAIKAMESLKYS